MFKRSILFAASLLLLSCGDKEATAIQNVIKDKLKDPGSAQFKNLTISQSGERACVVWNAKNSYGGYGEWTLTEFIKHDNTWHVRIQEGDTENCSEAGFKALDAIDTASRDETPKARRKAIDQLVANNQLAKEDGEKIFAGQKVRPAQDACAYAITEIASSTERVIQAREKKKPASDLEERLQQNFNALTRLNCKEASPESPSKILASVSPELGKKLYEVSCAACHTSGVAGAPRFGDKVAWAPRVRQNQQELYDHAIKGFMGNSGMMPARGGSTLTDPEIMVVVDYMVAAGK